MKIYEFSNAIEDYGSLSVLSELQEAKMIQAEASRYEYFVLPLVIHSNNNMKISDISISKLSSGGAPLDGEALCLSTSGRDSKGEPLEQELVVNCDKLKIIYFGYDISRAKLGRYSGMITIESKAIPIFINVTDEPIVGNGTANPTALRRLKWLNSKLAIDNRLIEGYEPIALDKNEFSLTGKKVNMASDGLISNVVSYYDKSNDICTEPQVSLFYAPMSFVIEGQKIKINKQRFTTLENIAGIYAEGKNESIKMEVGAFLRYEGSFDYSIKIKAEKDMIIENIALTTYFAAATYGMGLGTEGGFLKDIVYKWLNPQNSSVYVGAVNAGARIKFKGNPKNAEHSNAELCNSWQNFGAGSISLAKTAQGATLKAATGRVILPKGRCLEFCFEIELTPFRAINLRKSFATRQLIVSKISTAGKIVNECIKNCSNNVDIVIDDIYSATAETPIYANEGIKKLVSAAHNSHIAVKAEIDTNTLLHCIPAFENIGKEIIRSTPTGIRTVNGSRADNYLVECLDSFMNVTNIDGVSILNSNICGHTLERIKKICARRKGLAGLVDVNYNNQGAMSPFAADIAPLAFADKVVLKDGFDPEQPMDYIMSEMSGLLFGNTANIACGKYNGIKALLFGMLYAGSDNQNKNRVQAVQLLSAIDKYKIADSKLFGFWDDRNPMTSDKPDIYVTTFVKDKQLFAVIYNDNSKKQEFELGINPRKGFTSKGKKLIKPEIVGLQKKKYLNFNKAFTLKGKSGMIVVIK